MSNKSGENSAKKSGDFNENKKRAFWKKNSVNNFRGDDVGFRDFRGDDIGSDDLGSDSLDPAPKSLRERMREAINKKNLESAKKEGKTAKVLNKTLSPIRKTTSRWLRLAWLNIGDSCGLTILYILAHWELNKLFGDQIFCPYGYEWADAVPEKSGMNKQTTAPASNFLRKLESAGVGVIVLIVLFAVIGSILFMCIIYSPTGIIASLVWEAIKVVWPFD